MTDQEKIQRVRRKYRFDAPWYDLIVTLPTLMVRRRTIAKLAIESGQTVLDFGCRKKGVRLRDPHKFD